MSSDLNSVFLVGRLTRDAELKYNTSGFAICSFSLASNRSKKVGDNWEDEANFFDLTLLGKRGESLNQYLVKGQQIAVSGSLKQDRWEQDGQKRSKVKIIVNDIQLVGSRNSERSESAEKKDFSSKADYQAYKPPSEPVTDKFEDDIPF